MSTTTVPSPITAQTTVGELVAQRPSRARVFERFGIDYCCGGKLPLAEACSRKGISTETVQAILELLEERSDAPERDLTGLSMTELVEDIERTHHSYLKQELPRLNLLTGKVANRHGERLPQLVALRQVFVAFEAELFQHMAKEEQVLFPLCREMDALQPGQSLPPFHCGSVANPITVMIQEHDGAGEALARMRELTDDYTPPADACVTFAALYASLADLERDMHRHVHKENSVLFPMAIEAEARLRQGR
jgi:regulator of cell morphogenesis and NO signaling